MQEPIKRELEETAHGVEIIEHEIEEHQKHHRLPHREEKLLVSKRSIVASILSTLFLRVGSRTSFVILGFYLGKNFESAVLAVIVIEAFYISELLLAPIVGALSDRKGRKPFMLYAPVVGSIAALFLAIASFIFPRPSADVLDFQLIALLLILLVGRLLEGAATALNAPANLGYLTDATIGAEKLRARVVTAFEVATVGGIALAIPFGGQVYKYLGTTGFGVVIILYSLTFLTILLFMEESLSHEDQSKSHGSILESISVIKDKRIFTFMPAWLAVNMFLGAALTLITVMLAYPTPNTGTNINAAAFPPEASTVTGYLDNAIHDFKFVLAGQDADARHPDQLLFGGFAPSDATNIIGLYGVVFLGGMGIWMVIVPKMRRTTVMLIGLLGLFLITGVLSIYNSLAENPANLPDSAVSLIIILLPVLLIGVILQSGFTPASLIHLAAISETIPGKRGAVMGLYSVLLGVGQFLGAALGGVFVDAGGFYGLMIYSAILGFISLGSVLYMRSHGHDMLKGGGH